MKPKAGFDRGIQYPPHPSSCGPGDGGGAAMAFGVDGADGEDHIVFGDGDGDGVVAAGGGVFAGRQSLRPASL